MKLKGNYNIEDSGKEIIIFENEEGEELEVEFELWIDKEYIYEETGRFLVDVDVTAKCKDSGFTIEEEVEMEMAVEEYVTNSFNL